MNLKRWASKAPRISDRKFGGICGGIFLFLGLTPYFTKGSPNIFFLFVGFLSILMAGVRPKSLSLLNRFWMLFAHLNGTVLREVSVFLIFFFVMTPLGFFMRIFGTDPMGRSFRKKDGYWIERKEPLGPMGRQF